MARVQNTLIGRASGSVDGVTFLTMFRKNIMRAKMSEQTNPNTIAQQTQRDRFAQIVGLYRDFNELISIGLKNRNHKMTIFNYFQSLNMKDAFVSNGDGSVSLLPDKLKLSKGPLGVQPITQLEISFFVGVLMRWSYSSYQPPSSDINDIPYGLIINLTTGAFAFKSQSGTRSQSVLPFGDLPMPNPGHVLVGYLFFKSVINGNVSDTAYFHYVVGS